MTVYLANKLIKSYINQIIINYIRFLSRVSTATLYQWRAKYGGMDTSLIKRLKELEAENTRLKKMYAEERIKAEIRKDALEGKL